MLDALEASPHSKNTIIAWWESVLPMLVNERAVGPAINPFKERYYRQFGGSPTPEDLWKMNPNRELDPAPGAAKPKKNGE